MKEPFQYEMPHEVLLKNGIDTDNTLKSITERNKHREYGRLEERDFHEIPSSVQGRYTGGDLRGF